MGISILQRRTSLALLAVAAITALVAGVAPAGSAEAPTRENVRLITTVPGATGGHSFVYGDRLYVGAYGLGMRFFDVSDPANPVPIGEYIPGPQGANDPGARADAVPVATIMDGRHIAVLNGTNRTGSTRQSEFLDVTDPANPVLLHRFTGAEDGEAHNGDIAHGRRLWLPSGGGQGLRIYDLNPLLADPPEAPENLFRGNLTTMWRDSPYRGEKPVGPPSFTHIHDLEIYEDHPVQTGTDPDTGEAIFEPRDIVLVAEGGSYLGAGNTGSVFVVDITEEPVVLNRWLHGEDDPDAHPIRYHHEVQFLDGDNSIMIVTDEDLHNGCEAGGVYAVRVSPDLREAEKVSEWFNGTGTPAANCSAHVISSNDSHVFMGSYNAGLQVIDFSDPASPERAGQYIAEGANAWGALYHEGYVYVGDFGPRGLDVFQFIPDPVAQGWIAPNPATQYVPGVSESLCEQTGAPVGPAVDAVMAPIPEEASDGAHQFRATGNGPQPYNLKVYFYDEGCQFIAGSSLTQDDPDVQGLIPEGAGWAAITNALGGPTYVYGEIFAPSD